MAMGLWPMGHKQVKIYLFYSKNYFLFFIYYEKLIYLIKFYLIIYHFLPLSCRARLIIVSCPCRAKLRPCHARAVSNYVRVVPCRVKPSQLSCRARVVPDFDRVVPCRARPTTVSCSCRAPPFSCPVPMPVPA